MDYKFNNKKVNSFFVEEEYFPLIINYSDEELNNDFLEFRYKTSDLFEIWIDSRTKEFKKLVLTLCNHYKRCLEDLVVPDCEEGSLQFFGPRYTDCDEFLTSIYNDGVLIRISDAVPIKFYKTGQLIFALNKNNDISSIYVTNLTNESLNHIKNELNH